MNNQDVERFEHQVEDMYSILVNISSELVNIKVGIYGKHINMYWKHIGTCNRKKVFHFIMQKMQTKKNAKLKEIQN